MFKQFEIILTTSFLVISAVFLTLIIVRIRNIYFQKQKRVPIWDKKVGVPSRISKITMAISLLFMVPGVIYFVFVATMPSAVIRVYAKTLFCIIFSAWAVLEIFLCYSISEKLLTGSRFKRIMFFFTDFICIIGAVYLFPFIPESLPYPAESDCVILDLPVHGTWLAGQAGATTITNGHSTNRYAVDILKLGQDGRLFRGNEEAVTDYYSYDEPIFAPVEGKVTQIVDSLQSDLIGSMDEKHPGGNIVIIDIGNGKYVYFGHLKKGSIAVEEGQFVKPGTLLGYIGNSGYSTHPHLHMHVQNRPTSDPDGRKTYPFRFKKMQRKRLIFWEEIINGYLLRNDKFSD